MPSLHYHLRQADLGLLQQYARVWGIETPLPSAVKAAERLETAMQTPRAVEGMWARLPEDARAALEHLHATEGRMPWAEFVRRFGPFREMGPGRREREKPYEHPVSPAETLWYAGLVGRAFLPTPRGPVEFAYIPDELRTRLPLPAAAQQDSLPMGRPATPEEKAVPRRFPDRLLEHLACYLAARRANRSPQDLPDRAFWRYTPAHLEGLAHAAGLFAPSGEVAVEATRRFLEAPRGEALLQIFRGWQSGNFNDLKAIPTLRAEGSWENDPRVARAAVLGWLSELPVNTWWSLPSLVAAVKACCPHFQRPAPGDYDSWYLRDAESGEALTGWAHWDAVDGALIRFIITGPLAWFGVVALAAPAEDAPPAAFRLTERGRALLSGQAPPMKQKKRPLQVRTDGMVFVPWDSSRTARYQIARFADWLGCGRQGCRFGLSAAAMSRATEQGIHPSQVLRLLQKYTPALPGAVVKAIRRWEAEGAQATLRTLTVLQVRDPAIIEALRKSKAKRYIVGVLGPTAVAIAPQAAPRVVAALAEMGYFIENSK